jgi:hypothetical protein
LLTFRVGIAHSSSVSSEYSSEFEYSSESLSSYDYDNSPDDAAFRVRFTFGLEASSSCVDSLFRICGRVEIGFRGGVPAFSSFGLKLSESSIPTGVKSAVERSTFRTESLGSLSSFSSDRVEEDDCIWSEFGRAAEVSYSSSSSVRVEDNTNRRVDVVFGVGTGLVRVRRFRKLILTCSMLASSSTTSSEDASVTSYFGRTF